MTNRLFLSLVVGALLCLAGGTGYAQAQRSNSMRQTWEYMVADAYNDPDRIKGAFNQYGAQGWEYAGRSGDYYPFKRPR